MRHANEKSIKTKPEEVSLQQNEIRHETQELRIFVLGINSSYVERAIHSIRLNGRVVKDLQSANLVLCDSKSLTKSKEYS